MRDIETCLRAHSAKLYHLGIRGGFAHSTLADANDNRYWRICQDFSLRLIQAVRKLYAEDNFGIELAQTVYALDSTTIDLCLALFPWARFRQHEGAVKLHTLLDLRGNIPTFIQVSDDKLHDVNILDQIAFEAGSFCVIDRGYIDFARLHALHLAQAFFVTRAKSNLQYRRVCSRPVDNPTDLRCDQTIMLRGAKPRQEYPIQLRRVKFCDAKNDKLLVLLTNNWICPPGLSPNCTAVAGRRTLFQMDQAASVDQGIFSAPRKTRSTPRSGSLSLSPFVCSSQYSRNGRNPRPLSTQFYRS